MEHPILPQSMLFPPAMPLEVALNENARTGGAEIYSDAEIAAEFDLTLAEFKKINANPAFREQVLTHKANLKQSNSAIRRKCEFILESFVNEHAYSILSDNAVSMTERIKLATLLSEIVGIKGGGKSDVAAVADAMSKVANEPRIILNFPSGFSPSGMIPTIEGQVLDKVSS